jgi:hypothetical protein
VTIQNYDINLGPAGSQTSTQVIEASAQIIDYLSSGSAFDQIQVFPDFIQGQVTLKLGQGFDAGKLVNRWLIKNTGSTAIAGTVVLSTAGFRNFRISGDVNVLDGSKSRTLNGSAFTGYTSAGPVAAQFTRVQLWNPANSGVRLVLEAATLVGSSASEGAYFYFGQTALATLTGNGISKRSSIATQAQGQTRADTTATGIPGNGLITVLIPGGQSFTNKFNEPLIVDPGYGVMAWSTAANDAMGVGFEWYEEPNT